MTGRSGPRLARGAGPPGQVAIRKVNAITRRGCAEAHEASPDGQLSARGIHSTGSHER